MKTPEETTSGATAALLATGKFISADLYDFTLARGDTYYWCSGDISLSHNGHTYLGGTLSKVGGNFVTTDGGPVIERSSYSWKRGVEVSTLDLKVFPRSEDSIDQSPGLASLPFLQACTYGEFDNAEVVSRRAYMALSDPFTVVGAVVLFAGRLADIDVTRAGALFHINSHLELLNVQVPKHLYQLSCPWVLYGYGCNANGLVASTFTIPGEVAAGATKTEIPVNLDSPPARTLEGGYISLNGGTIRRSIVAYESSVCYLLYPLWFVPEVNWPITVTLGCDKQLTTCTNVFDNAANFGGCPFVPVPETGI